MKKTGYFRRAMVITLLMFAALSLGGVDAYAQDDQTALAQARGSNHYLGSAIGLGLIVIGAGLGIGRFAAAAAEGIARQPAAAAQISGAVSLPLFLLEGVAIIAEVVILLVVLLK
jgi:F-type H+-transporting ATPase subunit c